MAQEQEPRSRTLPAEIQERIHPIRRSLDDIETVQLVRLADRAVVKDLGDFDGLTSSNKEEFAHLDRCLDEVEILSDECEDDLTRSESLEVVEQLRSRLNRLRTSLRTISLSVKKRLESDVLKSSRAELLRPTSQIPGPANSSNPGEPLMTASSEVVQSLHNTLEIMKQELDRSVVSTQMLEQQTATLQLTSDQYTTFSDLMKTSRALLNSLRRADILDRLLFSIGFGFFILVCLYILKKRIFDRGVSLISAVLSPISRAKSSLSWQSSSPDHAQEVATMTLAAASVASLAPLSNKISSKSASLKAAPNTHNVEQAHGSMPVASSPLNSEDGLETSTKPPKGITNPGEPLHPESTGSQEPPNPSCENSACEGLSQEHQEL